MLEELDPIQLANRYRRLASDYADLYAQALKRDEERKAEIGKLHAEIVLLHAAIADLKSTIIELKLNSRDESERSGSFAAQEILNRDKLAALQEAEKERRATRAKFWGGVALIVAGVFAGGASTLVWHLVTLEAVHPVAPTQPPALR